MYGNDRSEELSSHRVLVDDGDNNVKLVHVKRKRRRTNELKVEASAADATEEEIFCNEEVRAGRAEAVFENTRTKERVVVCISRAVS